MRKEKINGKRIRLFICLLLLVGVTMHAECRLRFPDNMIMYEGENLSHSGNLAYSLDLAVGESGVLQESGEVVSDVYNRSLKLNETGGFDMTLKLFGLIPVRQVTVDVQPRTELAVCGNCIGVKIFTEGLVCVGTQAVQDEKGILRDLAQEHDVRVGDIFLKVEQKILESTEEMAECVEKCNENGVNITILRNGNEINKTIRPVKTKEGYKLGFWLRDSTAGIGTLTFYDPETLSYGALGHPIIDSDTGALMPVSAGELLGATILGVQKGEKGQPGALRGIFKVSEPSLGTVEHNTDRGIYGVLRNNINLGENYPIASKNQVQVGKAEILSNITGDKVERFDVEIQQNMFLFGGDNKNMVIRVTDPDLIEKTGGIVQGMSGSPIIQNGKLVGAVTHVFINDPTRGYGIFIENMLNAK